MKEKKNPETTHMSYIMHLNSTYNMNQNVKELFLKLLIIRSSFSYRFKFAGNFHNKDFCILLLLLLL